jgi:hypothetical protein
MSRATGGVFGETGGPARGIGPSAGEASGTGRVVGSTGGISGSAQFSVQRGLVKPSETVKYEKPDTSEYMMRQVKPAEVKNRLVQDIHDYYGKGGYQYGKRK